MIDIIEYKLEFTYNIKNIYIWCDKFKLNEEWQILKLCGIRSVEKIYMDRSPYIKPKNKYDIALYTKNKWVYLYEGKGETTSFVTNIDIPNLEITSVKSKPHVMTYKTKFELQAMLITLQKYSNAIVLERKKVSTTKADLIYKEMKLVMYDDIIICKGEDITEFENNCKEIECMYYKWSGQYNELFSNIEKPDKNLYMSLAYKTWFRAKRLNQKEWPLISEEKKNNGIEWKGVWYYHPTKIVLLAKRKDDNDETYIPKLYKEIKIEPKHTLPYSLKIDKYKNTKFQKYWKGEPCTIINYKGIIIETDIEPKYIVYNNMIIGNTDEKYKNINNVQVLNKENKVNALIDEKGKVIQYNGVKIRNKKSVPWYYRQILHDYNKFNRLEIGEVQDLMHIGIFDKLDKDIITWPNITDIYVGKAIETQRLITFKWQNDVKIKVCD